MTLARTWHVRPYNDHFEFGWEMARIARALVTGHGYADPFSGHTGSTAWVAPAYPFIIAGIFKLAGVYTPASAWLLLAINCVLSALMVRTTWEIAGRCFSPSVAKWSAWIWALYPAAMQYAVKWVWEMTLTAFLFSWVLVLALRMRGMGDPAGVDAGQCQTLGRWAAFGVLWGLIALSNPAILIFLPVCGVWILAGAGRQWPRQLARASLSAILCLALMAPWIYRNWIVFHKFIPLRGNFGAELYLGNGPGANGLLMEYNHPSQDIEQFRRYKQLGEANYVAMRGGMAKAIIAADTPRFIRLSLIRVYYFWFSVPHPEDKAPWIEYVRSFAFQFSSLAGLLGLWIALRRQVPAARFFASIFFLLPLVYYPVAVNARFRHPFEPLMDILAVYLFQSAGKSWSISSWRSQSATFVNEHRDRS